MPVTRPVAVKLDPDIHERVRQLAKAQDRSTHYMMREAIAEFVEREEKRQALRQDALNAWTTWQQTGQHVTHVEADNWLAKLKGGQDVEPPECQN